MKRPKNLPKTAKLNEFGQWEVVVSDDCYDTTYVYNSNGQLLLILEMEI